MEFSSNDQDAVLSAQFLRAQGASNKKFVLLSPTGHVCDRPSTHHPATPRAGHNSTRKDEVTLAPEPGHAAAFSYVTESVKSAKPGGLVATVQEMARARGCRTIV